MITTPEENDAVNAAEEIIMIESEQANMEAIFRQMALLGVALNRWRELMADGGYSQEWVEETAMTVFHKIFPPFVPDFGMGHDHDDD